MDIVKNSTLFNKFIKLLYIATAIGAFTDIFDTSVVGGASASIITSLNITTPEFGLLGSMTFIGGLIGAVSFGFISDRIGRRKSFLITFLLFIIFELLSGLAPNYLSLLIFRVVVGFAIGADYVPAITLLSEFVEPNKRGSSFDFFWIIANIGALVAYIVAFSVVPLGDLQWRVLFILGIIPPIVGIIIRSKLPETPRWLAIHDKRKEAEAALDEIGLSKENINEYKKYNVTKEKLMKPYIFGVTIPLFLVMLLNIPASGLLELTPLLLGALHIAKSKTLLFTAAAWVTPVIIGNIADCCIQINRYNRENKNDSNRRSWIGNCFDIYGNLLFSCSF
jgi:MFS family permease